MKKILLSIIFFLLLINFAFAELVNPSFELYGSDFNTQALGWTHVPAGAPVTLCTPSCIAYLGTVINSLRTGVSDANEGSNVLRTIITGSGQMSVSWVDLNYSQLQTNQTICVSLRETTLTSNLYRFGSWQPETNKVFNQTSDPSSNPSASWTSFCINNVGLPGKIALIVFSSGGGTATSFDIDNLYIPTPLTLDVLNYTQSQALVGETVTFKAKVLRTDSNQFVNDANVWLISSDFNAVMPYNSSTSFYQTTHSFSESDIGSYDFNFNVYDINNVDANLLGNKEKFSITLVSPSNLINQIENLTESDEFFISSNSIKSIMDSVDSSESVIFSFDGNSTYSGINFDLNFIIRNSNLSSNRFMVYTATENEYLNGTWNFNDTLTFGSTVSNGLQRIWIDANEFYEYSFQDVSVLGSQKKYYKLVYRTPIYYWDSLNPDYQEDAFKLSMWDVQLLPNVYETDAGHKRDFFSVSTYNNMRNQLKEEIPDINSNETYSKFLLVFNGSADSSQTIKAGKNNGGTLDTTSDIDLTSSEKTFHVSTGAKYPLIKHDPTSYTAIMLSDYALIERGFFLEPLNLRHQDGSEIEMQLSEGISAFYVNEGQKFKIRSRVFNRDDELSFIEGKVYFGSVAPANQVAYFKKDLNFLTTDETYLIDWSVDGINDLNGTGSRVFIVVLKATNKTNDWFEIQTVPFRLKQFPTTTGDYLINVYTFNHLIGEHLKGTITIMTPAPEVLRGVKTYLYKIVSGSIENADYNTTFWKDTDFSCNGFLCSFDFELKEHVFSSSGTYVFVASSLLTTSLEDTNNELLTARDIFPVNFIDVNVMRLVETIERIPDHNYRNTEVIPITLILRRTDLKPTKDDLKIVLRTSSCLTGPPSYCLDYDVNYSPQSYIYDATTGDNYYFWRQVFLTEAGSLLIDNDWIRFTAIIEDATGKFSSTMMPVLSPKCQSYPASSFIENTLHFLTGTCTTNTNTIVSIPDNNSQEIFIHIDNDFPLNNPNQECFFCVNTDKNNIYISELEQDILCGSWYTFNTASIDNFDFYLTNKYSDLTKKGNNKQFISGSVPFELIAFNDLGLIKQSLKQTYGTEPTTIGEFAFQGLNTIGVTLGNPLLDYTFESWTGAGIIKDFGMDCNLSRPLDKTYIGGMLFYQMHGIKTVNQQDLIAVYPDLNVIDSKDLIEYMNYKGYKVPRSETIIDVFTADGTKLKTITSNDVLIINEKTANIGYKKNINDVNNNYESLPKELKFTAINDLIYNNNLTAIRGVVPFTITAILQPVNLGGVFGLGDPITCSKTDAVSQLLCDPAKFFIVNFVWIFFILAIILVISVIYSNFAGR